MTNPTRTQILQSATAIVQGEREQSYGGPESSFTAIAELWTAYLGRPVHAQDVALMMALMKIARLKTAQGVHWDSWVDLAGYAACGAECVFPSAQE